MADERSPRQLWQVVRVKGEGVVNAKRHVIIWLSNHQFCSVLTPVGPDLGFRRGFDDLMLLASKDRIHRNSGRPGRFTH